MMIYDWERGSVAGVEHMEWNMVKHIPSTDAVIMKVTILSMVFCLHKKFTCAIIIISTCLGGPILFYCHLLQWICWGLIIFYFHLLLWILHDWVDKECVKLLRRSYDATPAKGKGLIVEAVVEGDREGESMSRRLGLLYHILMMVYTTGGKERTKEGFKGLFQQAGFNRHTIIKLPFLELLILLSKS